MTLLEVMPDAVLAYRSYLGEVPEVTSLVPAGRIYYGRLPALDKVILPAIRVTELSVTEDVRHRWARSLMQLDVWHSEGRLPDCRAIAEVVRAALVASPGQVAEGWVLGGVDNVNGVTAAPFASGVDETFNPAVPRYVITAGLLIRPN